MVAADHSGSEQGKPRAYKGSSLSFPDVNEATVKKYGYKHEEFLAMTIMDIRDEEDIVKVKHILSMKNTSRQNQVIREFSGIEKEW